MDNYNIRTDDEGTVVSIGSLWSNNNRGKRVTSRTGDLQREGHLLEFRRPLAIGGLQRLAQDIGTPRYMAEQEAQLDYLDDPLNDEELGADEFDVGYVAEGESRTRRKNPEYVQNSPVTKEASDDVKTIRVVTSIKDLTAKTLESGADKIVIALGENNEVLERRLTRVFSELSGMGLHYDLHKENKGQFEYRKAS